MDSARELAKLPALEVRYGAALNYAPMADEGGHGRPPGFGLQPVWTSRTGQVALVTGGSAGLGLAIATALATRGSDVVLASRSLQRCVEAAARVSRRLGGG